MNDDTNTTFYDELIDFEYQSEFSSENVINELLRPSKDILAKIKEYLKNNSTNYVTTIDLTNKKQYFIDEDLQRQYFFDNDERILTDIQHIIFNLKSPLALTHALKKRPKLLKSYAHKITFEQATFSSAVLKTMPLDMIQGIVLNILSQSLCNKLLNQEENKNKELNILFLKSTLAQNIGDALLEGYILLNFMYSPLEENQKSNLKGVVEYKIKPFNELLSTLESIKENRIKIEDSSFRLVVISFITNYLGFDDNEESKITKRSNKDAIIQYAFQLGIEILSWLQQKNVFESHYPKKHNVEYLTFVDDIDISLITAASFFKPLLSLDIPLTGFTCKKDEHIQINLRLNTKKIPNKSYVHIKQTTELEDLLHKYNKMPYSIQKKKVSDFMELLEHMSLILSSLDKDFVISDIINAFFKTIYDIDVALLLANNSDKNIIKDIIRFGLSFSVHIDDDLENAFKTNGVFKKNIVINQAAFDFYYKVRGTKYYLIGLINDLQIYQYFGHFFIPRYPASSGRVFCKPYFLQLMGHKLSLFFIACMKKENLLSQTDLSILNKIILEKWPTVYKENLISPIEEFNLKGKALFKEYIHSFCTPFKIEDYPYKDTIIKQLIWLSPYCKKNIRILYVRNLIHSYIENTYITEFYEKDASSSGLQQISFVTHDQALAEKTNLQGNKDYDLYSEIKDEFINKIDCCQEILNRFCNQLLKITYEEFIITDNNNFLGKLRKLLLFDISYFTKNYDELKNYLLIKKEYYDLIINFKFKVMNLTPQEEFYILQNKHLNDPLWQILFKLRIYINIIESFKKLPLNVIGRKLYKESILAAGYSQGKKDRARSLRQLLIDFFSTQGFAKPPITKEELDLCLKVLLRHFDTVDVIKPAFKYLHYVKIFLAKELKKNKRIIIKLPYITYSIECIKRVSFRPRVNTAQGIQQFTLYKNYGTDRERLMKKFPSIFIHSLDSQIIYDLIYHIDLINDELLKNNLEPIVISTRHDSFGINGLYAPYLIPFIRASYDVINQPEMQLLLEKMFPQFTTLEKIQCSNNNFIKY